MKSVRRRMDAAVEVAGTEQAEKANEQETAAPRKVGGKFAVLDRDIWERLWTAKTVNRLNLVSAFLVLLSGTGPDHRTTSWSAKACEDRVGMGKPRAKKAIEELVAASLASLAPNSTPARPKYILARPNFEQEPIFLPVQMVTGFGRETGVLRRVRETGDAGVLRMLVDLYGQLQIDAAFGVPLAAIREFSDAEPIKISEMGANAVWALARPNRTTGSGNWVQWHRKTEKNADDLWEHFWRRFRLLQQVGAVYFESWLFAGCDDDAEPIMPLDPDAIYSDVNDDTGKLTRVAFAAASNWLGDRSHLLEQHSDRTFVLLPAHHQPPSLKGVLKLRVEADTSGRRRAFAKRMAAIRSFSAAFEDASLRATHGDRSKPISLVVHGGGAA